MYKIEDIKNTILCGDVLTELSKIPKESVDCIITSPPFFGLRDYGVEGQIGLESTLNEYLEKMLTIMVELKRVLKPTGTMWWNHGDSYASEGNLSTRFWHGDNAGKNRLSNDEYSGRSRVAKGTYPAKSLLLQNYRLAIRMIDEQQWILRNCLIWHKPNCMPSSVKDRFTVDYEPVFFFSKSKKYWFELQYEPYIETMNRWGGDRLKVQGESNWDKGTGQNTYRNRDMRPNLLGRNKRSVWRIPTQPYKFAHFATFPEKLVETPIKAGCPESGLVLDPFMGAGTVAIVAKKFRRDWIGIELSSAYCEMAYKRINLMPKPML